jgi:tol-pal system protein YbgF
MKARLALLLFACHGLWAEAYALPAVIDNSAYPATSSAPVNVPSSPSTNSLFEIMARLEQLQTDVQQLTGKVEEQANTIAELKKQQGTRYTDLDERVQGLETKLENANQPAAEASPEAVAADEATANSVEPPAPEAGTSPEPVPAVTPTTPEASPVQQAPAPKAEEPQASGSEKQEYYQAYNELRNGHTGESISLFTAYLVKYPTGGYANNAQYWLGEAYRVNQDDTAASTAFNAVIANYPNSAKVPDALLKLGYIEMDKKNSAKAREYLTRVTTEFSNTPAARLAAKKLLLLDAAGQ